MRFFYAQKEDYERQHSDQYHRAINALFAKSPRFRAWETGKIKKNLANLNKQAEKRLDIIMEQMKAVEGVTKELKAKNQWKWVQKMNSIRYQAEEIVKNEMIYI